MVSTSDYVDGRGDDADTVLPHASRRVEDCQRPRAPRELATGGSR